jgi:hypothetical protein
MIITSFKNPFGNVKELVEICFNNFLIRSKNKYRNNRITMLRYITVLIFSAIFTLTHAQNVNPEKEVKTKYYNREYFLIEGTAFPDSIKESPYDRFPASYKDKVRKPVWDLSKSSAGISVRFLSNSSAINVKWQLLNNAKMNHMAETGIKGLDLYCKVDNNWQYVNTARPTGKENEFLLINNMPVKMREYRMYLPLYDGVTKLEIGIDSLSKIEKPISSNQKPIVFYGTSITQGGCASRPGMAYTNIISRKLNVECLNFGFSGNGKMEQPVAELIAGINASCYVIDGTGNMSAEEVHKNAIPLVKIIRSKHPSTPIVFVECTLFEKAFFEDTTRNMINKKNLALKIEYEEMVKNRFSNIYYIDNKSALGNDHEATVDDVHFTDLGFLRFADFLISKFNQFKLTKTITGKK